ncbi:hypothetical protein BS17DRAFT_692255, partial [Gyrodon lividus]
FGPMLIGVFLNSMLYGVVPLTSDICIKTFVYFQSYKKDSPWIKCFVCYLLFCETLNTGFDIGMMYEPLIVRYGDLSLIRIPQDPVMTVMISSAVQLFIAWRVKVMSGSKFVPFMISFFAVTSLIGGIATTVSVTIINDYASLHRLDGAVITWLGSSAAADVIITVSLVWSLASSEPAKKYRQKTGFAATDDLINRLIRLTVQTGLITAVSATLDVSIFLAGTTLNYIWDFALSKLYSNSLLSTLNARGGWKASSSVRENVLFGPGAATSVTSAPVVTISQTHSYGRKQVRKLGLSNVSESTHRGSSRPAPLYRPKYFLSETRTQYVICFR